MDASCNVFLLILSCDCLQVGCDLLEFSKLELGQLQQRLRRILVTAPSEGAH